MSQYINFMTLKKQNDGNTTISIIIFIGILSMDSIVFVCQKCFLDFIFSIPYND